MPNLTERIRDLKTSYRTDNNLDPVLATVITQNGQMQDPLIPGNFFVAYPTSNGLSTVRSVGGPAKLLPLKPGTPVVLERFRGRLRIKEIDPLRALASGSDPAGDLQYTKQTSTPQGRFETLRLIPKGALIVSLRSWNVILGGVYYEFSFPDIDLTSYVPASGNMLYAVIAVMADLTTTEITTSTARSVADVPLDAADVNEAIALLTAGSTPTWAVKLIGDQTEVTQDDIDNDAKDLRQIVNSIDNEYAATVSTTNATVTTLYTFTIPATTTYAIRARVVARRTGGGSGTAEDGAYYERSAAFKNVAGTATQIGATSSVTTIEDQAGWDVTFDVTGATARIRVTGAASNDVNWAGRFEVFKVS